MADHDALYHRLFSHPLMVEQLLRDFVPAAMAAGLDFGRLQRVNAKFHAGRRREGDVVWRLPTASGGDIYLYLLLEFQSDSDWWMAVRAQVYEGLLWQHVIAETGLKTGERLPPVMMLALYNGERRWSAPTDLADLIALPADSPLWHWQPQIRYHLLDMGAFAGDELARRDSLTALLFRLEQRHPPEELEGLIDEVIGWFGRHPGADEIKRLFTELVRQAIEDEGTALAVPDDLLEMRTMLPTLRESWKREWLAQGKAEGLAQGKAEALVRLIEKRYGPLPPASRERIMSADAATIEAWLDRVMDAPSLEALFGQPN